MTFTLIIECDGEAFSDRSWEVSRILRVLGDKLCDYVCAGDVQGFVRDINGNRCGAFRFDEHDGLTIDDAA